MSMAKRKSSASTKGTEGDTGADSSTKTGSEATTVKAMSKPAILSKRAGQRSFYLVVTSRDHVHSAIAQNIVQVNHGKKLPLQRMKSGDGVVFYSPRLSLNGQEPCKRFTALARILDNEIYQVDVTETFKPWRRRAEFVSDVKEVALDTVLRRLTCLGKGEKNPGLYLRRGFLPINADDWDIIEKAMLGEKSE